MENNKHSLIAPNVYIGNNEELGHQITNAYIDENNALRQMWGYEEVEIINGQIEGKILAQLVTSKQYLVCCDREGVYVLENISNKYSTKKRFRFINFANGSRHRKFQDVRIKTDDGKDKYGNGYKYLPNEDGFNMAQAEALQTADNQAFGGFIYITDGSIGGLYILAITTNLVELFQFDYQQVKLFSEATVMPFSNGKVIHCVSPVKVELFNQRMLVVDERWNYEQRSTRDVTSSYFYAIAGLGLNLKENRVVYENCQMSQQFKMAKPVVTISTLNNLVYVFSQDRIEFYTQAPAQGSLTGIQKISSNAVEVGVESRNLIYTFNGNQLFIGSSSDKRRDFYFFEGGKQEPIAFTNNNLSYLLNNKEFDPKKISITAFSTTTQEFAIINGLGAGEFGSFSIAVEITQGKQEGYQQKSTLLVEEDDYGRKLRFKSDEIFNVKNDYYFVSYQESKIYFMSQFISDYNGKPIILEIRSAELTPTQLNTKLNIKLDCLVMQKMPEDWLHPYNAIEYLPHIIDKNSVCFEVFYKSFVNGKFYKLGEAYDYFPINTATMRYDSNLPIMSNVPRGQVIFKFYPKIYEKNNQLYASTNVINFFDLNVTMV